MRRQRWALRDSGSRRVKFLDGGQLLLEGEHRLKKIAHFVGALQDHERVEDELLCFSGTLHLLEFLPGDRRGNGGAFPGSQRVDANSGLMVIVLAPIDEDFASAKRLLHVINDVVGMIASKHRGQGPRESFGLIKADGSIERDINLKSLGPGGFREGFHTEMIKDFAQPKRYSDAV